MKVDYHLHTFYSDGENDFEDYIKEAIELNFSEIGFSDHYTLLPSGKEESYSLKNKDIEKYIQELTDLQKKYHDRICIKIGIEIDYFPQNFRRVLAFLNRYPFDYYIVGIHYVGDFLFDSPISEETWQRFSQEEINEIYDKYFELIVKAIDTGGFQILAHPDLIKKYNYKATINLSKLYKNVIYALKNTDITLEVNQAGLRHPVHEIYPEEKLLKIALQNDISLCISSDSHNIKHFVKQPRESTTELIKKLSNSRKIRYSIFTKRNKKDILL